MSLGVFFFRSFLFHSKTVCCKKFQCSSPLVKGDHVFFFFVVLFFFLIYFFCIFKKMIIGNSVALNFTYNYNLFKSQQNSRWCGVRSCNTGDHSFEV